MAAEVYLFLMGKIKDIIIFLNENMYFDRKTRRKKKGSGLNDAKGFDCTSPYFMGNGTEYVFSSFCCVMK